jgi:hypothetical protein
MRRFLLEPPGRRYWAPALAAIVMIAAFVTAPPPATADDDAPIGNIGQTLRVQFEDVIADVTVHDVQPAPDIPPGWGCTGTEPGAGQGHSLGFPCRGYPWRAAITVHPIKVPNQYKLAITFAFDGVTPYADAYKPRRSDAPDALDTALLHAPQGSTVDGAVYWDVYRALVTNVVLYNPKTGYHLAQWNIWQPGSPLP